MTVQASVDGMHGHPKNTAIYRRRFVKQIHSLVAMGYARLNPPQFKKAQEPAITGELVRCIKEVTRDRTADPWVGRYAIHDDPPVNVRGLKGKNRPKVDIEVEKTGRGPHPLFQFEAKKLPIGKKDAVREYVGEKGLGCFISGKYAESHEDSGMLGYVQAGSIPDWAEKVRARLEEERESCRLLEPWKKPNFINELEFCFFTVHNRSHSDKRLTIYHTFLDFS